MKEEEDDVVKEKKQTNEQNDLSSKEFLKHEEPIPYLNRLKKRVDDKHDVIFEAY